MLKTIPLVSLQLKTEHMCDLDCDKIDSPENAAALVSAFIGDAAQEHLLVCALNGRLEPTCVSYAAIGSDNAAAVSAREIVKPILLSNAPQFLVGHNHPSGSLEPSRADLSMTKELQAACQLLQLTLVDHVIVTPDGKYTSLKATDQL
jgi:DNA repair protein RadC